MGAITKPVAMAAGPRSNGALGASTADQDSAIESRSVGPWWSGRRPVGTLERTPENVRSRNQELEREKTQLTSDYAGQISSMSDQVEAPLAAGTCVPSFLLF